MNKWIFYSLGLSLGLLMLVLLTLPSGNTEIIACDVGQGDAILIIKDNTQVLVDGGPSGQRMLACLERHVPFYDRRIELVVLTHSDNDHINGLSAVVERYEVAHFVTADGVNEGSAALRLAQALEEKEIGVGAVEQGDLIRVGSEEQLILTVLWPPEVDRERVQEAYTTKQEKQVASVLGATTVETNERSVVLLLSEGEYQALLTGDMGQASEWALLEQGMLPDIEYLKAGHHGSKYSTSETFLQTIKPEMTVISAGAGNWYGHPTGEVLERLSKIGSTIRRTDLEGDVIVTLP